VTQEVARLNKTLPGTDRARLNEYLDDIREIERRLHNVAKAKAGLPVDGKCGPKTIAAIKTFQQAICRRTTRTTFGGKKFDQDRGMHRRGG